MCHWVQLPVVRVLWPGHCIYIYINSASFTRTLGVCNPAVQNMFVSFAVLNVLCLPVDLAYIDFLSALHAR